MRSLFQQEGPFSVEVLWSLIAVAGGIAKYLSEYLRDDKPFRPYRLFANVIISGFSGWMFAHTAVLLNIGSDGVLLAAGVGGYLGIEGIQVIIDLVKDRLKNAK